MHGSPDVNLKDLTKNTNDYWDTGAITEELQVVKGKMRVLLFALVEEGCELLGMRPNQIFEFFSFDIVI